MTCVVGVRFKRAGKMYYFDPGTLPIVKGQQVVVETVRGIEIGEAVTDLHEVQESQLVKPIKQVIRIASAEDVQMADHNRKKEEEAFELCLKKISQHNLDMKLVDVEYTFDGSKIVFYFTADGRIDFRELVKDLASAFKTRIELRQIGVRDEAKMLGGLGKCGQPICCGTFLGDFQPVSIRMAKEQNLSLNPTKISGLCGRLMCCLKYEQDFYESMQKKMPKLNREVMTPDGLGVVVENNLLLAKSKVRITLKDGTVDVRSYGIAQLILDNPPPQEEPLEEETVEPVMVEEEVDYILDE
ncbi:MAG: PSP1 domain-containing protein [Christensenellales bacterium]